LLLVFDEAFEREKVLDGTILFLFDSDVWFVLQGDWLVWLLLLGDWLVWHFFILMFGSWNCPVKSTRLSEDGWFVLLLSFEVDGTWILSFEHDDCVFFLTFGSSEPCGISVVLVPQSSSNITTTPSSFYSFTP
jgi:hypothetical protein